MVVEPESLCWLTGRMVQARDGVTWAQEFARFPALKAVVRDDGSGLGKGLKLERARRCAAGQSDIDDTLDIFHTFREGGRALRKTWGGATRALEAADAAQRAWERCLFVGSLGARCGGRKCLLLKMIPASRLVIRTQQQNGLRTRLVPVDRRPLQSQVHDSA